MFSLRSPMAIAVALTLGFSCAALAKEFPVGAIAIDSTKPDTAPAYGIGGGDTEAEAGENAVKFCVEAGGKGCKVVVSYPACGAYAGSKVGGGWGLNTTKKTAEAQAMSGCDHDTCKIVVSDCN